MQRRLQEAGTYHVIAISGGNIAIVGGLLLGAFRIGDLLGRAAMASAIVALALAVARPVVVLSVPSNQTTIVLAMDVSGSMCSSDIAPTRLDAAKDAAVAFVNRMMIEALRREASDIHVEPERNGAVLRYRVDGVLRVFPAPPPDLVP